MEKETMIPRKKPLILKKEEAISRLEELRYDYTLKLHAIPSNLREIRSYEVIDYLKTVIELLQTSSAEKVKFHYLTDCRKEWKIPQVYLPLNAGQSHVNLWEKFVTLGK